MKEVIQDKNDSKVDSESIFSDASKSEVLSESIASSYSTDTEVESKEGLTFSDFSFENLSQKSSKS